MICPPSSVAVIRYGAWYKMKVLFMLLLMAGMLPCGLMASTTAAMNLTIVNQSGYSDDQVYVLMICSSPVGYLDFQNHVLVETPAFSLDAASMTASLSQIKAYSSDGTCTIACPAMGSSRIYFAFGKNFDQMNGFAVSGPSMGASNPVRWAMFEVNLSGNKFLNQSNVDFFGAAYTLTAINHSGESVTVGIDTPAETIFEQFESIPYPDDSGQPHGNTKIFKALVIKDSAGDVVRVLSPKAAALSDVNTDAAVPQMLSHFFDDYVTNHCWKPGRTFSFSSKLASDPAIYYGKVSPDGQTLSIYTDAAMTVPYAVPSLPCPCNSWGTPGFTSRPELWHNVGAISTMANDIDWGYLLFGQDGYSAGPGAYWITDPVAMAIPISIVRGVMHLDNGQVAWKDSAQYYQGTNGVSTPGFPVFYYGQILHRFGLAGKVYALSFDDVYGTDSGLAFTNPAVTLTLHPFAAASSVGPRIKANGVTNVLAVTYPERVSISAQMNPGIYAGLPVDWWVVAYAHSGAWYYLNHRLQWTPFQGGALFCQPVYQGPLCYLASYTVPSSFVLPVGTYDFWFAVDYPMDGILGLDGAIRVDKVTVNVR